MKKHLLPLLLGGIYLGVLAMPFLPVQAQTSLEESFNKVDEVRNTAGVKDIDLRQAIISITAMVATISAVLAVLAIIIGGIYYILSLGDPGRAATGKKVILYAVIGLIIIGLAAVIVNTVVRFVK